MARTLLAEPIRCERCGSDVKAHAGVNPGGVEVEHGLSAMYSAEEILTLGLGDPDIGLLRLMQAVASECLRFGYKPLISELAEKEE